MYQVVSATELKAYQRYAIRCSDGSFFTGTSMGIRDGRAFFWNVERIFAGGFTAWIPTRQSPTFSIERTVFKRFVSRKEYQDACRAAYEKKITNLILQRVLGDENVRW